MDAKFYQMSSKYPWKRSQHFPSDVGTLYFVRTLVEGVLMLTHPSFFAVVDLSFHGCGVCVAVRVLDQSTYVFLDKIYFFSVHLLKAC